MVPDALARKLSPSSPARFVGRISCACPIQMDPGQGRAKALAPYPRSTCKIMRSMHALAHVWDNAGYLHPIDYLFAFI